MNVKQRGKRSRASDIHLGPRKHGRGDEFTAAHLMQTIRTISPAMVAGNTFGNNSLMKV